MITGSGVQYLSYRGNLAFACKSETFRFLCSPALLNHLSPNSQVGPEQVGLNIPLVAHDRLT